MPQFIVFFVITFLPFVHRTNGVCTEEGVMVVCETVTDFGRNEQLMWKDVMIKSDIQSKNYIEYLTLSSFQRVENLAIVGKTIDSIYSADCYDIFIKLLTFYDNKIRVITRNAFRIRGGLDRLRLINNQIEELKFGSFAQSRIKTIDLSNNLLDLLVEGTFTKLDPAASQASATEVICLKNNRITYIEANTFPQSLRILNLDHNQLSRLDNGLNNLTKLQILYINHNKLRVVPDFRSLKALQELELSHNDIEYIAEETFDNLTMLRLLDLSHNQLAEVPFLSHILVRDNPVISQDTYYSPHLDISLAFNRLYGFSTSKFENDSLKANLIIFYGNPWDCAQWTEIENIMSKTAIKRSECDLKHFNGGRPFCVSYERTRSKYHSDDPKFFENMKDYFAASLKTKSSDCALMIDKNMWTLKLYRLDDKTFVRPCRG